MPLLHIMGVSATHQSISLCFGFIRNETKEDYIWILQQLRLCFGQQLERVKVIITDREIALMNAIKEELPRMKNLLCSWHIEKNLVANLRQNFSGEDWERFLAKWQEVCTSLSATEFDTRFAELRDKVPFNVITYLQDTWVVHKEKFVLAWTKEVKHFGHLVTSRVEAGHASLKSWIWISKGDMDSVYHKIQLHCQSQFDKISHKIAHDQTHLLTRLQGTIWTDVNRKLSHYSLLEVSLSSIFHFHCTDSISFPS